ncbi:hypothetical protein DNX69_08875 [Rhodopseudomonas palustris]|uniref:DUF4236 domain-containing protein n=1 Tax=Rhodopseudomonas palustris TaxID=1076 RepID=A0A323UHQ3_RHOPL|nr:DUF4236 domain-containing protein [Rhodopseudomonas palustris]PZA12124.1 hypothetical protein DNX69_08875 [Rhodopseudomonas palustris]
MPFYFRKSVSAGPFRFSFSRGGVGMSVGVKGLRIGAGPRGNYIHAGFGGVYYRSSIRPAGQKEQSLDQPIATPKTTIDGVEMVEIESGSVLQMRSANFADILDDLNIKASKLPLSRIIAWTGIALGFGLLAVNSTAAIATWTVTIPAWIVARWLDSYRRKTVLFYELESDAAKAYERLTEAFDLLIGCAGKWHIRSGGAVRNLTTWKRNAGATHIVDKKPTRLDFSLPLTVASNITPPCAHVGDQVLYFLPDVVLVAHGKKIGAIDYNDLKLHWQESNFIEEGSVPSDAKVVGQTWKHPNKSGGPDRRYKDNWQIPICRYEALHLSSNSGLNELLEFSKATVCAPLATAVRGLAVINGQSAVPNSLQPAE